jgi:hypothetical protein
MWVLFTLASSGAAARDGDGKKEEKERSQGDGIQPFKRDRHCRK